MTRPDALAHWPLDTAARLQIEQLGVAAWPALATAPIGDWLWRWSESGSQRANSVACLGDPGLAIDHAIDAAEALYRARGAVPLFQVSTIASPPQTDEALAARGYRLVEPCTWLAIDLSMPQAATDFDCTATDAPDAGWMATYLSVISANRRERAPSVIARVPAPRRFASARIGAETVATALTVIDGPLAVVECVATRDDARRSGAATAVMRAVLAEAQAAGARIAALGVVTANAPAMGLYSRLGFVPCGGYHYRRLD